MVVLGQNVAAHGVATILGFSSVNTYYPHKSLPFDMGDNHICNESLISPHVVLLLPKPPSPRPITQKF